MTENVSTFLASIFNLDGAEHQREVGSYEDYRICVRLDGKFYVYPPADMKPLSGGSDTFEDAVARAKSDLADDGYDDS